MVRRVGMFGMLLGLVGLMAACYKTPTAVAPTGSASPTGPAYSVKTGQATVQGGTRTVVVDPQGFTLYFRSKDTATSVCSGNCATTWPPLTQDSGPATASPDLTGTLRVAANANGNQLVYNNHPLYRYSGDAGGGQANGQAVAGIWFVVDP
jgi:predicted lipoprotein with Yx(FWY)xxD motif